MDENDYVFDITEVVKKAVSDNGKLTIQIKVCKSDGLVETPIKFT